VDPPITLRWVCSSIQMFMDIIRVTHPEFGSFFDDVNNHENTKAGSSHMLLQNLANVELLLSIRDTLQLNFDNNSIPLTDLKYAFETIESIGKLLA
jgi:hypothetical protein